MPKARRCRRRPRRSCQRSQKHARMCRRIHYFPVGRPGCVARPGGSIPTSPGHRRTSGPGALRLVRLWRLFHNSRTCSLNRSRLVGATSIFPVALTREAQELAFHGLPVPLFFALTSSLQFLADPLAHLDQHSVPPPAHCPHKCCSHQRTGRTPAPRSSSSSSSACR